MKLLLLQLASLMILSLFSCSEMDSAALATISEMPEFDLSVMSSYLEEEEPDSRLNETAATTKIAPSVKSVFKKRFNIPELVTADIDENEKELAFILESFSKFAASPDNVYQALRSEFLFGNNFNTLLPHLMRYFDRRDPKRHKGLEIKVLLRADHFDYIFNYAPELLEDITNLIFYNYKLVLGLQKHILANPEKLELIEKQITSKSFLLGKWNKVALISNMPSLIFTIIHQFPVSVFEIPSIFTGIHIAKEHHSEVFEKIKFLIDGFTFHNIDNINEKQKYFYHLMNLIRFGPEDPQVFETQILPNISTIPMTRLLELCRCASLASKMDLFFQLLPHVMSIIECSPNNLNALYSNGVQEDRLELHKFIFDVHANCELLRPAIYEKSNFIGVLSKFYRVTFIKLNDGNELIVEFKIDVDADTSVFPETLLLNYLFDSKDKLKYILEEMIFDNAQIFENFLVDLFSLTLNDSIFRINAENLSLIMKSESIRLIIYQFIDNSLIPRQPFIVSLATMMNLDDLAGFPLFDIAHPARQDHFKCHLPEFRTHTQLHNLESLLGESVSQLLNDRYFNYFHIRHVFDYLIKTGQPLPRNLSESVHRSLKIDYPELA